MNDYVMQQIANSKLEELRAEVAEYRRRSPRTRRGFRLRAGAPVLTPATR